MSWLDVGYGRLPLWRVLLHLRLDAIAQKLGGT